MEFDELPTHIQEQWEQSEQFGDELRMIRTLRAGRHGEWAWSKDKSEFTADAIKKIERHRRGFFHPHEAAAEISRLKPFEEAAERKLLTKIVDDIKTGIIPIYREPLMFKETFTTDDKYSELEILLNASDLNEWLRSRNTDLQLMTPEHSAAANLPLTNVKSLSTPQTAPASEPVKLAALAICAEPNELTDSNRQQPGNEPSISVGKLAVRAAWIIECKEKRRATGKEVMRLLQEWAIKGIHPDVLRKSDANNRGVVWITSKYQEKTYTLEACQRALGTWNKSRQ